MFIQPPPAPTVSAVGPCPTIIKFSRTPLHWKFTQNHRSTRPPPHPQKRGRKRREMIDESINVHTTPPAPTASAVGPCPTVIRLVGWLVGFGFNGPLRQYFSLYRAVSQGEGENRTERIDESKNVQTTPTRTYCKRSRPLPYCITNCRTPQH